MIPCPVLMEMEVTRRRSTVETVLRCGLVIVVNPSGALWFGVPELLRGAVIRCCILPSTGSILRSRMVPDHTC